MSGHHTSGGSNWKLGILVGVLVVVIVALAFLCIHFLLGDPAPAAPETTLNISAQIAAQDAAGKDVTNKLAIAEGTLAPDTGDPNAQFMLLDISWAGKKDPSFPMIVTISDPSFTNDDGLAVYHYSNDQWTLLGTYLIKNNSVSFQADSFSPFAFQVISANPQPTPTPEATPEPTPEVTPEPTPEVTPEPTPEPIDYGKYDEKQDGTFVQAKKLSEKKNYVIALIDTETEAELPQADGVTFFGDDDDKVYNAQILLHYDEEELRVVEARVAQTDEGQFYILDPVVEGMLWTTENEDYAYGADRFSLVNNGKYLNLDDPNEYVVLDEDEVRTRWLYEEIDMDGKDVYTLTYRANLDRFFVKEINLADEEEEDEETESDSAETLRITATATRNEALVLHIFALDTEVETDLVSGTLVTSSTPVPTTEATATPKPTSSTGGSSATPTAAPTKKPEATTKPTPTTVPTAEPTKKPVVTDEPTPTKVPDDEKPTTTPSTGTTQGQTTPVPTPNVTPSGTNT